MEITLQQWTPQNAAARVPMLSDPRVLRWMSKNRSTAYNLQDSLTHLHLCEATGTPDMAIVADGTIVGGIGMSPKHPETPSFNYYLHPDYWGRGIATRAVGLFLQLLAHTMPHITTLHAAAAEGNTASCRVLERNGSRRLPGTRPATIFGGMEVQAVEFEIDLTTIRRSGN